MILIELFDQVGGLRMKIALEAGIFVKSIDDIPVGSTALLLTYVIRDSYRASMNKAEPGVLAVDTIGQ